MKLLLDTHILLWAAGEPERLSRAAKDLLNNPENEFFFSPASLWEIIIKQKLERPDFQVNARLLRRGLLENEYQELKITSEHVMAVGELPPLHKDLFDRILIAQSEVEGFTLLTTDALIAQYPALVQKV